MFCEIFNHLEDFLERILPGDYPDKRPWPIRMLTSWIATLAVMTDKEAMGSLRRARWEARNVPVLPYEVVFGEKI
jgi:hypothetical protein